MPGPTTAILDNFNRPNSGPPLSANWLEGWGGGFQVVSNYAQPATTSPNVTMWATVYAADQEVYGTVINKPTSNDTSSLGFYLRLDTTTLNGYMVTVVPEAGNDVVRTWRVTAGAVTKISEQPCEFAAGDQFLATAIGNTISVFHCAAGTGTWSLVSIIVDTNYNQPGHIGVYAAGNSGALDEFGGGNYVPPAELLLDTIQAISSVDDRQSYLEAATVLIQSGADVATVQQMVDSVVVVATAATAVTDVANTFAETVLVTAIASAQATAAQSYVDGVTAIAQSAVTVEELKTYLEQLTTAGQAITSVADRQTYYDNVLIMAMSGASLGEIGSYIEQVQTAAVGSGSVVDVLQGAFIGAYILREVARPRIYTETARPRGYVEYARRRPC